MASEEGTRGGREEEEEMVEIHLGDRRFPPGNKRRLAEQGDFFRALPRSDLRETTAEEAGSAAAGARLAVQRLRGGLSEAGLTQVLRSLETARLAGDEDEPPAELLEAASSLQVRPLLRLLPPGVRLPTCPERPHLARVYGLPGPRDACLDSMAGRQHQPLARPDARQPRLMPDALAARLRQRRHRGRPTPPLLRSFPVRPPPLRREEEGRLWSRCSPPPPPTCPPGCCRCAASAGRRWTTPSSPREAPGPAARRSPPRPATTPGCTSGAPGLPDPEEWKR